MKDDAMEWLKTLESYIADEINAINFLEAGYKNESVVFYNNRRIFTVKEAQKNER